jgi:hypothetical protein
VFRLFTGMRLNLSVWIGDMTTMVCWNRVAEYAKWRHIFGSHAKAHHEAGLKLIQLWRTVDHPFGVHDIEEARAFVNAPGSAEIAKDASVLGGAISFLEDLA